MILRTWYIPCLWVRPAKMIFSWDGSEKTLPIRKGSLSGVWVTRLKKGAALNAVQIAEYMVEKDWFSIEDRCRDTFLHGSL